MGMLASAGQIAPWWPRRLTLGSSRLIVFPAIALALAVGVPCLLAAKNSDIPYVAAIVFLVLAGIVGGCIGGEIDSGRTLVGRGVSRHSFRTVRDVAVQAFGRDGWAYGGETADSVWYSRSLGPSWALVALLFPLGVLPAVMYLILARRKQRAEIRWWSANGKTAVEITVSPKGYGGQRIANALAQKLV
jgi:hypothetical protein